MKYIFFGLILLSACSNPQNPTQPPTDLLASPSYDSISAARVGADDYGMKPYIMVFLKRGPNRSPDSTTRAQLQAAHMANIVRLADEGKLVLAGPMMSDEEIRGIYIFNVATVEEAIKLTETDPAIKAGSLIMEMHPWYASAALVDLIQQHKRLVKKDI